MTGKEFVDSINKNPSWCASLKNPLEVTTFADLYGSLITHLSPLITFSGRDASGNSADLSYCENLKVATGTFNGFISFVNSGVEKIEKLNITGASINGDSINFSGCENLKVATGTYKGAAVFHSSGVTTIKNLNIETPNDQGRMAYFRGCPITYVPKKYRTKKFQFDKTIKKQSDLIDIRQAAINKIKSESNNIEI